MKTARQQLDFHLICFIITFSSQICDDEDTGAIGIKDMGGIFIVIGIGVVLALITLAGEFYYYKIRASRPSDKVGESDIKKVAEIE